MADPMMTTDDALFQTQMYNDTLLPIMKRDAMLTKLIQEDKMAEKHGTDVYFFGRNPIDPVSGTLLAGTEITDPTPVHITGRKIKSQLYRLHNSIGYSKTEKQTTFDGLLEIRDIIATNIVESLEIWNWRMIAPYVVHVRSDWDITTGTNGYQIMATASGAGSTTTIVDTTLVEANDWWGGNSTTGYAMPVTKNNDNYGQGRITSDFDAASDTVTVSSAWNTATAANDVFILAIGTALAAGDKLTVQTIGKVMALMGQGMLDIGDQFKFANPSGYGFKLLISTLEKNDLINDTNYLTWVQYNDKSKGFEKWSVGNIYNNEMLETGLGYRESVAGAYSATGAVYNALMIGKKTAVRTVLNKPTIIPVDKADSGNLANYKRWLTWTTDYACGVNVGTSGCVILNVPTAIL
jgi:hypothetical protein